MYNPMLDTFITVADYGSFTKAAAQLYISPTAVMKQMNALEQHLQLQLIERTPAGVHLTPAGNVIYRDAKFLMDYSKKSIAAANAAAHTYDTTFCVGTSLLNPAKPFIDLWYRVNKNFPDYKLHLVPFEDDHEGILSEIEKLGEKFEDTQQFYDLSVFNRCAETGNVLLTIECWQDVHPGLVTIPVNWHYSIPYGLLYSNHAPEDVLRFVETVERLGQGE